MKGKKLSLKEKGEKIEHDQSYRRSICQALCKHLGEGYSLESFSEISTTSLKRYINLYKEDFPQEDIEQAMQKGRDTWERLGFAQANGQCIGNSRTWYYNMANRYGWREKIDIEAEHKGQLAVNIVSYASSKASTDT